MACETQAGFAQDGEMRTYPERALPEEPLPNRMMGETPCALAGQSARR